MVSPCAAKAEVDDAAKPAARPREDQRLTGEILERARAPAHQAMVHRHDHRHTLAEERVDLEIDGTGRRRSEDAEVVVTAEDAAHDLGGGALLEGEAHRRVALEEPRETLRQPARPDRVEERDAHAAALGCDGALRLGDGVPEIVEEPLGTSDQTPPRLGQADVPADPLEERHPDLLLEAGDLARDGGLVSLERFRGAAEVLDLGNLDEGSEEVGIDAIHASI